MYILSNETINCYYSLLISILDPQLHDRFEQLLHTSDDVITFPLKIIINLTLLLPSFIWFSNFIVIVSL